ncbi:hypothetical protein EDD21DRAFT_372115 [Dissophora ornata]|nr:hypothetical protein EDD21DRAFT_372115 [Dissophora ornata]
MFKDSTKIKNLAIHVDTGATIGPKDTPLIYGHSEALTLLQATVSFETSHDCKAKGIEVSFKAAAGTLYYAPEEITLKLEGEQVFYSKQWDFDVQFSKPGWIAKGTYSRQVSMLLDPTFPSSTYHFNGWMKYEFEARLKESKGFGIARTDIVVNQEVWVLNSSIPAMELVQIPVVTEACWKRSLPFLVTIPSKTLCFGQVVPVTIQVKPCITSSELEGQEIIVTNVSFALQETRTGRALYTKDVHQLTERFINLSVNTGWPQSIEGWERTIFVSLPSSPALSASMVTRFLDITHSLVVTMEFRSSRMKSGRIQVNFNVDITSPRTMSSAPPVYGDAPQHIDAVLGIPTDFSDELPRYARYES